MIVLVSFIFGSIPRICWISKSLKSVNRSIFGLFGLLIILYKKYAFHMARDGIWPFCTRKCFFLGTRNRSFDQTCLFRTCIYCSRQLLWVSCFLLVIHFISFGWWEVVMASTSRLSRHFETYTFPCLLQTCSPLLSLALLTKAGFPHRFFRRVPVTWVLYRRSR